MNEAQPSRTLRWPGDPATLGVEDVDFEAIAHVLANTCCWGGRSRRFYSVAQHAVTVSGAAVGLGRMGEKDRNAVGLYALLEDAPLAWTGAAGRAAVGSGKAPERATQEANRVRRTVLEAAGLDPELPQAWVEGLTFSRRMAEAALYREFPDAGAEDAGPLLPPLKGRIRPLGPDRAAKQWLDRFAELTKGLPPRAMAPGREGGSDGVPEK